MRDDDGFPLFIFSNKQTFGRFLFQSGVSSSSSAPQTAHKAAKKKTDQFLLHNLYKMLNWPTKQTCGGIFDRFCSRAASVK